MIDIFIHIRHISLKEYKIDKNKKNNNLQKSDEKDGKIIYFYPLINNSTKDLGTNILTTEIFNLINLILKDEKNIINIYSEKDKILPFCKNNIKTIICLEIIRFFYRHQKFNGNIFYILNKDIKSLKEITDKINGKINIKSKSKLKNDFDKNSNSAFIAISSYHKLKIVKKNKNKNLGSFFDGVPQNFKYLILSNSEIKNKNVYNHKIADEKITNNTEFLTKESNKNNNKMKKISSKNRLYYKNSKSNKSTSRLNNKNNNSISNKKLPKTKEYDLTINDNTSLSDLNDSKDVSSSKSDKFENESDESKNDDYDI